MSIKWSRIEPNDELDKKLFNKFTNKLRAGYGEFGDEKTVMSIHYADIAEKCANLEVKNSDVFVASYPKTGTTWSQEMVWMIMNNVNFEGAKRTLADRFPFLEFSGIYTYDEVTKIDPDYELEPMMADSVKCVDIMKDSPRLIKTHLAWHLLPKQIIKREKTPKIIYITRNTKDTCVSYYYHCILKEGYNGDFETFCDLFLSGRLNYGNYLDHINGYWKQRNQPNILFITYEDMKRNLPEVIGNVASFLDKSLTDEQTSQLAEHLSFDAMKKNPAVNSWKTKNRKFFDNNADGISFLRSGTVGGYKKDMSPEMIERFDEWIKEYTQRTGINIHV